MKNNFSVSIIMSAYNASLYISETIESVLNQSFHHFEFLIVDDGSTDDTLSIIKSYPDPRIKSYQIENSGVAFAKNFLIKKAQYDWIAIIDADDTWSSDKLEKQVEFLFQNPKCVLLGTFARIIDKDGQFLYIEPKITDNSSLQIHIKQKNQFTHSSVIYNKNAAISCGLYYEKVKQYIVDYKLLHCLCTKGEAYNLALPLVNYRIVPGSLSTKNDSPVFKKIMNKTIELGYISEEDLETLKQLKNQEKSSPKVKLSNYHYYIARVYLFYNFKRKKALTHFWKSLSLNYSNKKTWAYLILSMMPKFMIQAFYKKYFGNSENFNYLP